MATRYYSMAEVAQELGISRAHVYHLKDTRKLKVKKVGAQWVVSGTELERIKRERNGHSE